MSDDIATITFRLPASLREKIKSQAAAEDRSESAFIRYHIARLLELSEAEASEASKEVGP